MEVIEIISNFINKDNNVVEVEFRLRQDNEDMVRTDTIEFHYMNDFGYGSHFIPSDLFEDNDDFGVDFDDDEDFFIDEEEMMYFLNEYYLIYEGRLPDADYR